MLHNVKVCAWQNCALREGVAKVLGAAVMLRWLVISSLGGAIQAFLRPE
jgi:hypothetical protein